MNEYKIDTKKLLKAMKDRGINNQVELAKRMSKTKQNVNNSFFFRAGYNVYRPKYIDLCNLLRIKPNELIK